MSAILVWGIVWPPMFGVLCLWIRRPLIHARYLDEGWISGALGGVVGGLIFRDWALTAVAGAHLAIGLLLWWHRRRKGRRKALVRWGARELARLRSMLVTLRERAKPRPVFSPGRVTA